MKKENKILVKSSRSEDEKIRRQAFVDVFRKCPIPDDEILANLSLFINRQNLSEILFMNQLYEKIINVHGVVMELGVRWGRNLALLESLRGIYEPYNHNRKIIGFDTFEGFPSIDRKDGSDNIIAVGSYSVTKDYYTYLDKILAYHETESPISHIKKYEIIKGNAVETLKRYLEMNPATIIAMAYFDFDIYEPTKSCLELIRNHITKGTVIGFDELNDVHYPGETIAMKEILGLDKYAIRHSLYSPSQSYLIVQ